MPIDATRTGVASQLASYFSSNYEALLLSSAAQQPVTPLAPQDWKDALNASSGVSNGNTRFFLKTDGTMIKVSQTDTQAPDWQPEPSAVEIDLNVAYGIERAGLSPTDWLMQRIADEFRMNANQIELRPLLTQYPAPEVNVDISALSTANLVSLINHLLGRSRDGQRDTLIGDSKGAAQNVQRLGLSVNNLSQALELQALYQNEGAVRDGVGSLLSGEPDEDRDALVKAAIDHLVMQKHSELEGARMAFATTGASQLDDKSLSWMLNTLVPGVGEALKTAGDIVLMRNPALAQIGTSREHTRSHDGYHLKNVKGLAREQLEAYVKAELRQVLDEPEFRQNLIDALAATAQKLGTSKLPLTEQHALYAQLSDATLQSFRQNESYLDRISSQSVNLHDELTQLIRNEVEAQEARESEPKKV